MLEYFGLDWIAMALSFAGVWMLGNKKRDGFIVFAISNVVWVAMGFVADSYAVMIGNAAFLFTNIRGYLRWKAESNEAEGSRVHG